MPSKKPRTARKGEPRRKAERDKTSAKKARQQKKKRSVMPNKPKIQALRQERGWTQEFLAKKVGCNTRNIQRIEQDGCRVAVSTLTEVAQALDVEVRELVVPDFLGGDDPQLWLKRAIRYDMNANYGLAIEIAEAILHYVSPEETVFQSTCVRLASFHEHCRNWEVALNLLEEHLLNVRQLLTHHVEGQSPWALYQRGLIRRCLAEDLLQRTGGQRTAAINRLLTGARTDLERIIASPDAHKSAPLHQLGVLLMLDKDYPTAIETFQRSLRLRQSRDGENPLDHEALFRHGYTYRRLGQCYAHMGRSTDASECLLRAKEIAETTQHKRLAREVERDLTAWELSSPSVESG